MRLSVLLVLASCLLLRPASAFMAPPKALVRTHSTYPGVQVFRAVTQDRTEEEEVPSLEETTEKFGLEAGLFQAFKGGGGKNSAKALLQRYGSAYLLTSISLAIVSFSLCYLLVDNGVDVGGLLSKVGINATGSSEKVGTAAIAYAAHKAASPIRFPTTVALTPVVAKFLGKEEVDATADVPEDEDS